MDPLLVRGVGLVTVALVLYSVAFWFEQRSRVVSRRVLIFLSGGVVLDVSSTALMILGSRNFPLTVHGLIGYSALAAMFLDAVFIWQSWRRKGDTGVSQRLNRYTQLAYGWWVTAYLAGIVIAIVLKA